MSFFTIGNLLTLGIVAAVLILYRQLDKKNRSMDKVRKYGEKLKEDLSVFIAEKESSVRDYAIELDVQQKAAKELMNRLVVTDEGLAGKAEAVARIDERISAYDKSLNELMMMTSRVEENLERIRDESDFVESSAKKVTEAKSRLTDLEKSLSDIEFRFERENAEALERTMEASIAAVKSTVSDMQASAETIERQVEDHREAVAKIEQQRAANLARDTDIINKLLRDAVEKAGVRADKMEDAALIKLKEQAVERTHRFKDEIEEKLKTLQETAKVRMQEIQGLVKSSREEWKTEHNEIESKQKSYRDEWKKDVQELNVLAKNHKDEWKKNAEELNLLAETQKNEWKQAVSEKNTELQSTFAKLETQITDLQKKVETSITSIDAQIKKTAETAEQKALEAAETKLEVYRTAQTEEFRRLESISNDIVQLDAELHRYMQDTEKRVRNDFALFEKDSADSRNASAELFASSVAALKSDMNNLEQELNLLKNRAYENVSEKLKIFEDDFVIDLSKRSDAIDQRFIEWKNSYDSALTEMGENGISERKLLEQNFTELVKTHFVESDGRILAELDHLKAETRAFEEGIREQMEQTDHSMESLRDQINHEWEDARTAASAMVKTELGKHELSVTEMLKHSQREIESSVKKLESDFSDWKTGFSVQLREANDSVDETKRQAREIISETENHRAEMFARTEGQVKTLEAAIHDTDRQMKEFINQTKLFDQTDQLKTDLERSIEDLKSDLNRLEHQRMEIGEMETQFAKLKRLEDEVNAKMTRFLSEKRRIELMEADFNRLITTSQAVEEKLAQVSTEDDTLQSMQVQLRRLHDALSDTEEKYQRIEKKNQTLEMTNESIDRNFKILQETEGKVKSFNESISRMQRDMEDFQDILANLTKENEKVRLAQDKLSELDETLVDVEKRIESMQVAREWLARTESRLEEVSKQAQDYVKLLGDLIKGENKKGMPKDRGAPPIGTRETVIKLAHQGWKVDEIARAVGLSKGEVELIMEISPKD